MDEYRMSDRRRAILEVTTREQVDYDADLSYLEQDYNDVPADEAAKYREQDRERLEAYQRGEWWCVGIDACAVVVVNHVRQTITSGGLWGIESDSGEDYLREVAEEELSSLADILRELGFTNEELVPHWPAGFSIA